MSKIKKISLFCAAVMLVVAGAFCAPLAVKSGNSSTSEAVLDMPAQPPKWQNTITPEQFVVFRSDNVITPGNISSISKEYISHGYNYQYEKGRLTSTTMYLYTQDGYFSQINSADKIFVDIKRNDGTTGQKEIIFAPQYDTQTAGQYISFEIEGNDVGASYAIRAIIDFPAGSGQSSLDFNTTGNAYIFSMFPDINTIENATLESGRDVYYFNNGTTVGGEIVVPYIDVDTRFYEVTITHRKGIKSYHKSELTSGQFVERIYFTYTGHYFIDYTQLSRAVAPIVKEPSVRTQTLAVYGAMTLFDSVEPSQFLKLDTQSGALLTPEVRSSTTLDFADNGALASLNPISTNRTEVWWEYFFKTSDANNEQFTYKTSLNAHYSYRESRSFGTEDDFEHDFASPHAGFSKTGFYFVTITMTTGEYLDDEFVRTAQNIVQKFMFEIKNTNPLVELLTEKQVFDYNDGSIRDEMFYLQDGDFTRSEVEFFYEEPSLFDKDATFFYTAVRALRSAGANLNVPVQLTEQGQIIAKPENNSITYIITVWFGLGTVNQRSEVLCSFTIDTTDIILMPYKIVYDEDEDGVFEMLTQLAGVVTTSDFRMNVSKENLNNCAGIELVARRYVSFDQQILAANSSAAKLDSGKKIAALKGGASRTRWEDLVFDINPNTKAVETRTINAQKQPGLYEFVFMDKASNISFYYIYVDTVNPNFVYEKSTHTDNTVTNGPGGTGTQIAYDRHNVYFGEQKAVRLPTNINGDVAGSLLNLANDHVYSGSETMFATSLNVFLHTDGYYYILTDIVGKMIMQPAADGEALFVATADTRVKEKTSFSFHVSENVASNQGPYSFTITDKSGNKIGDAFTIDLDPAQLDLKAKQRPNDDNYANNSIKDPTPTTVNGITTTTKASGTNFNIVEVSVLKSNAHFTLDSLSMEYTAPDYTKIEQNQNIYATPQIAVELLTLPEGYTDENNVYHLPALNSDDGGKTKEGRYRIVRSLGAHEIIYGADRQPLATANAIYTVYVDRVGIITPEHNIGSEIGATFYGKNKYPSSDDSIKTLTSATDGFSMARDKNGELNYYGGGISTTSNLTTAHMKMPAHGTKFGTNTTDQLFRLRVDGYIGNEINKGTNARMGVTAQTDLSTVTDSFVHDKIMDTAFSAPENYNFAVFDGMNSLIRLKAADGSGSEAAKGNSVAFSYKLTNEKPRGTASVVKDSVVTTLDEFSVVKIEAGTWVKDRQAMADTKNAALKNKIFVPTLKAGQVGSSTFDFVVENNPDGLEALVDFSKTIVKKGTIALPTPAAQGNKQTMTLTRENGAVYYITLEYYDPANPKLLTAFRTVTYEIIIDGDAPGTNLRNIQTGDYFYSANAASTNGIDMTNMTDYIYALQPNFVFTYAGDTTNINTYKDTYKLYYRSLGSPIEGYNAQLPTLFPGDIGYDDTSLLNPRFDESSSNFARTYKPHAYGLTFAPQPSSGTFEIIEIDAAGNAQNYFVWYGAQNDMKNNKLLASYKNYSAHIMDSNTQEQVVSEQYVDIASTALDAISSVKTINAVPDSAINLNFSIDGIDSADKYFEVAIYNSTMVNVNVDVRSQGVVPIANYTKLYVKANTSEQLSTLITNYIRAGYDTNFGNQFVVRVLDRFSTVNSARNYYSFIINLSPLARTVNINNPNKYIGIESTIDPFNGINLSIPTFYRNYEVPAQSSLTIINLADNSPVKNMAQPLPFGRYHLTYENNYGFVFDQYVSTIAEYAMFESKTGSRRLFGEDYFGEGLSFYFSSQVFRVDRLVVKIGDRTLTLTENTWQDYVESFTSTTRPIGALPVDLSVITFRKINQTDIKYSVYLEYLDSALNKKTPEPFEANYYTVTPTIELIDQFGVIEELTTSSIYRATEAALQTYDYNPFYQDENQSSIYEGKAMFVSYTSLTVHATGLTYAGATEQIVWSGRLEPSINKGFRFTTVGTSYKQITYTMTFKNLLGVTKEYTIIIDSEQQPNYVVMQGSTILRRSATLFNAAGTLENPTTTSNSNVTLDEWQNRANINCEQYYTAGTISESMIVLAQGKGLTCERVDNKGASWMMIFRIKSDSLRFKELRYIKINKVDVKTDLGKDYIRLTHTDQVVRNVLQVSRHDIGYNSFRGDKIAAPYNTPSRPDYGMEYYAVVETEGGYRVVNTSGEISITDSGVYTITYMDLAGNIHHFASGSGGSVSYQYVVLINQIPINVQASNYTGDLVSDMVLENSATLTIPNRSLYIGGNVDTLQITSIKYDGISQPIPERALDVLVLSRAGVWDISYTAKLGGGNSNETSRKYGEYRVFITNPTEQRLGLELTLGKIVNSTYQSIEKVYQRSIVETSGIGEDLTILFRQKQNIANSSDALKEISLSEYESGAGFFTVVVSVKNPSGYKQDGQYTFRVLISNLSPVISSNIMFGSTTNKKANISFVPAVIFENYGSIVIKVNGSNYVINESSANNYSEQTISLGLGKNIIEIKSGSENITYARYTITRTEALSFLSIMLIVAAGIVLCVVVIIFFRLRTKMKVR